MEKSFKKNLANPFMCYLYSYNKPNTRSMKSSLTASFFVIPANAGTPSLTTNAIFLFSFLCLLPYWSIAQNALIKIDIERKIDQIDPLIYGNFAEHLGRCIYGGLYDPQSPLADDFGFRKDVAKAAKELNTTVLRWPGGNFVSGYHWEDGIGAREKRPVRIDLAWGAKESNQIGTDEFLQYCERLGTAPYLCVNMGTGTLDDARNWVEYCNIDKGTFYSDLRRKNGRELPYQVKFWGLGNEMDGDWQMGHKNAEDYGKYALEAAKMMKWIDPSIKLVVSGSSDYGGDWIFWNRTVFTYLKDHADYISLHRYVGNSGNDFYKFMTTTIPAEQSIKIVENQIREVMTKSGRKEPIHIAFDEYNVWYRAGITQQLEEKYTLEDALIVAQFLNIFVRNAQVVKMANMAQLVNVIAPMIATKDGLFYQTIFYPLALFANNTKGTAIQTFTDCATFSTDEYKDNPYLDVSAAYNQENKELIVNVVNRNKDQAINTDILSQFGSFSGKARISEVNGKDLKDVNDMQSQRVKTVAKEISVNGTTFTYAFPAHSFTQILIKLE